MVVRGDHKLTSSTPFRPLLLRSSRALLRTGVDYVEHVIVILSLRLGHGRRCSRQAGAETHWMRGARRRRCGGLRLSRERKRLQGESDCHHHRRNYNAE